MNIKQLSKIIPVSTNHTFGMKQVLLKKEETNTNITQIAITKLNKGETIEYHTHPTMEEFFFVRKGKIQIKTDNDREICEVDDFIIIKQNTSHAIEAITDCEIMTIGASTN